LRGAQCGIEAKRQRYERDGAKEDEVHRLLREAAEHEEAKGAGRHERTEGRVAERLHGRGADSAEDHRKRQREPYPAHHLPLGHAHAETGFHHAIGDRGESRVGVTHHGEQCIEGECGDHRRPAEPAYAETAQERHVRPKP
jgi:hypothetical protein